MARSARWARIPEQVICDARVSDSDLRVYAALALALHGRGYAPVSHSLVAQLSRRSVRTVQRCLARLVVAGYVLDLGSEPGAAHEYSLVEFPDARMPGVPDPGHSSVVGFGHSSVVPLGQAGDVPPGHSSVVPSPDSLRETTTHDTALSYPLGHSSVRTLGHSSVRPYIEKRSKRDLSDHNPGDADPDKDSVEDSSGDTPETPFPSLAEVQVIHWADICALVPAQWLRSDRHLKQLVQTLEDDAIRDPAHPWHGSMLVRSPETIGGWRILPDPDYLLPSPP